jgi:DNA-binding NarL/FixJ family response regulator
LLHFSFASSAQLKIEECLPNRFQSAIQSGKAKVFLVDDHPIVRQGLGLLINREPDLVVCGEAEDAPSALQRMASAQPDLMVIDISLEGPDGLELLKTIRLKEPILPVLILSMHEESTYAERSLRAGANGYIMKQEATERVLVAIRRILEGKVYLSERLTNKMLEQFVHGAGSSKNNPLMTLSDRELEVYRLIAEELHVSVKTVESYQAHIKEKLSLRNARELVQHAIESTLSEKSTFGAVD